MSFHQWPPHIGIPMGMRIALGAYSEWPPKRSVRPIQALAAHPWDLPGYPRGYFSDLEPSRADQIHQEVEWEAGRIRQAHVAATKAAKRFEAVEERATLAAVESGSVSDDQWDVWREILGEEWYRGMKGAEGG